MGKVTLIVLPYDSGKFGERMGRGPLQLIDGGLADWLRKDGSEVEVVTIRIPEGFQTEASALIELQKLGSAAVRKAALHGRVILLSGNCGAAALSAGGALPAQETGVIWFDAHADFNTPETSRSGFLDGMSLSILTGHCWAGLTTQFSGYAPILDENVILVGARDLDVAERELLRKSPIKNIPPANTRELEEALKVLSKRVENLYVHVDMDVLDESEGHANSYACRGGLSSRDLYVALESICAAGAMKVASITAYDPSCDHDGKVRAVAFEVAKRLAITRRQGETGAA